MTHGPSNGVRRVVGLATVLALTLGLGACTAQDGLRPDGGSSATATADPAAEASAKDLASAINRGNVTDVPFIDAPGAGAQGAFTTITSRMGENNFSAEVVNLETDGDSGTAELKWMWALTTSPTMWSYVAPVELVREGETWRPKWSPTLIHPKLAAGEVMGPRTVPGERGRILAADGVVLAGKGVTEESKTLAADVVGTATPATAAEVEQSERELITGELVGRSGLQQQYDDTLRSRDTAIFKGTPDANGALPGDAVELGRLVDTSERDVRTTLDPELQRAAQQTLADTEPAASIVAIRPSDHAIVALANGTGSQGAQTATLGEYAPGSIFKVVTALAMIRKGDDPNTIIDCPMEDFYAGHRVANYYKYPEKYTGKTPFKNAMAHSCNTVFAAQFDRITQAEFNEAAQALGVGVDMDPGVPAVLGTVQPNEPVDQYISALFGQGRTLVSPLSMARMQASVQAGELVNPVLVKPPETTDDYVVSPSPTAEPTPSKPAKPLTTAEARQLHELEREVVASGSLTVLRDLSPDAAIAKSGTAEYGTEIPMRTHSWVVAGYEDLAISVFVSDGDLGSVTAGPLALRVLQAASEYEPTPTATPEDD